MNKFLASSTDPNKLSLTIKGVLGGVSTLLLLVLTSVGVNITSGDLQIVIDGIGDFIVAFFGLLSTIAIVYGGCRKIYYQIKNRS